jgi:hypothetical protein
LTDAKELTSEGTAAIAPSPHRGRAVSFGGKQVTVMPLRVGQLPRFVAAMRPIIAEIAVQAVSAKKELKISADSVIDWIERYTPQLVEGVSAATALDVDEVNAGDAAEFLELATAVVRVNLDFFVRRLLPMFKELVSELDAAGAQTTGIGPTRSKR